MNGIRSILFSICVGLYRWRRVVGAVLIAALVTALVVPTPAYAQLGLASRSVDGRQPRHSPTEPTASHAAKKCPFRFSSLAQSAF